MSQPETQLELKDKQIQPPNYLSGWRLHAVIGCLFWGAFLIALDTNIINVALPVISSDFEALEDFAWYGSAYLLTLTAMQPIYGSLYKYFRTDVVYRLVIVIFEVGSVICAAATNSNMFIVGRAVAGFGAAGVLQGALSIISQVVPLEKRPLYMGVVISVFVITVTIGPVLGGVFTQHSTWRWCFWINLPVGGLVLLGLTVFLRLKGEQGSDRDLALKAKLQKMDPLGCLLFTAAACCLLLALQWGGQTKPWNSPDVIGCLVGAFSIGSCFTWVQLKRGDNALIPLRVLHKRSVWTGAMVLFFLGAQTYLNTYFLPFWFQGVRAFSPVRTGLAFMALLIPQMISLIIIGAIVKQFGSYVPYILVGELIAIGGQAMLTQLRPESSVAYWAASLVVAGLGTGMAMQLPFTAIALVLSDNDIPIGNAIAVLFQQLGGALFISLGQTVTITSLTSLTRKLLPEVPPQLVVSSGVANLDAIASDPRELAVLRNIWNSAVARTMILAVAVVAASVPFTLGMEWLNSIKVAAQRREAAAVKEDEPLETATHDVGPNVGGKGEKVQNNVAEA
ncbi:hypothetical protein LA080_013719 [Diaporthe eres]|nr:hypothetical protein LA080_013719 [Diaporthe eres]